jgi:hypothetical protein
MPKYQCSSCDYVSSQKAPVIRHINKKISCGSGTKEVIEIPTEIKCEYCTKKFSTEKTLAFHVKNNCYHKNDILVEKIKKLEEENKLLKERPLTVNNDNRTINVYVNNYEDTNLEKLTDKIYNKIIKDSDEPYQIIPRLIKHIHCNPDLPENHNIRLSNRNKNNKYLEIYQDKKWSITDKKAEIGNLISDKETNMSDWIAKIKSEKGEKYPEALEKFNDYLEQKYDEDIATLIKEEVEVLLYNNRQLTKS